MQGQTQIISGLEARRKRHRGWQSVPAVREFVPALIATQVSQNLKLDSGHTTHDPSHRPIRSEPTLPGADVDRPHHLRRRLSFQRMPVDAYPDLSPPMVEIITQWAGHAAEEIERLVTLPLELEMNGVPQLVFMRSISLYGLSDVILTFEDRHRQLFRPPDGLRAPGACHPSQRRHPQPSRRFSAPAAWSIAT